MWETAHSDLVLEAFQHRRIALRFIRTRVGVLFGAEEARNLEVQSLSGLNPGQFQSHPLFWRFCVWRYDEDRINVRERAAEFACVDGGVSTHDAIVKAVGQAIERWSKWLKSKMAENREMKIFHPELLVAPEAFIGGNESPSIDAEVIWIVRLAFVRDLNEWKRFHEALPTLFVSQTRLTTCIEVGGSICSSRPPKQDRDISRAAPPNEKGLRLIRRWLDLSPHQARQRVIKAKDDLKGAMMAQRQS